MSAKAIDEYTGKELLYRSLSHVKSLVKPIAIKLNENSDFNDAVGDSQWAKEAGVCVLCFGKFLSTVSYGKI